MRVEKVLTSWGGEQRGGKEQGFRDGTVGGDVGGGAVDGDRPVLVEVLRPRAQRWIHDGAGSGAQPCHACRTIASRATAAKHPEQLIDRVVFEGEVLPARGRREIRRAGLVGLELCPPVRAHVVLPHIAEGLRCTRAEQDGHGVDGIEGGLDLFSWPPGGIGFLRPAGRPALARRGHAREED